MDRPLRVIQCGTGLAGTQTLGALLERPEFQLAGLLVHNEKNAGRDAGTFVGMPDCGIKATTNCDEIVTIDADIVIYMLIAPDADHFCKLLASGKNVVTITGFMRPGWRDPATERRLRDACTAGQSSFYVTGINPGFVSEILPLTLSHLCRNWSRIQITETANCAPYPSRDMLVDLMGFGQSMADVEAGKIADLAIMADFFQESVIALAEGLSLKLDDVKQTREFVVTKKPLDIKIGRIDAGTVAGQRWRWTGIKDRQERIVIQTYWILDFDLGLGWPGPMDNEILWNVNIEGKPSLCLSLETRESLVPGFVPTGTYNPATAAAAMSAVHSLSAVVAAPPGFVASGSLPQLQFRSYGLALHSG